MGAMHEAKFVIGHSAIGMTRLGILKIRAGGSPIAAMLLLGMIILVPSDAIAQDYFSEQINRLRRDMEDLQSYVYRSTNAPSFKDAKTSNNSNLESTALLQRQVLEMQTQLRELTGQLEQVNHTMQRIGNRLDKLVGDVDLRLRSLEAPPAAQSVGNGPLRAGPPRPSAPNLLGTVKQRDVDAIRQGQKPRPGAVAPPPRYAAAPAPRSAPGPAVVSAGGVQQTVSTPRILPDGTVQEQYTFAFKLLRKRDYVTAETALREFIERHPDVPLAGNAMYWMGETYYVRKDYEEAARIFLDAYQRFPKGNKAADNLFKLAKSLAQIGENASACATYGKLLKSLPTANARILASARSNMSRLECS